MKYWIETLIELPVRRGDKYEWSMFRNPNTLANRIIADCLTGPEPKLAEGSTVGVSRQLMKKGWKVGGHQIIRQEHSVFLCSSIVHVFFSF